MDDKKFPDLKLSLNSAYSQLAQPANVNTSYQFGDILGGGSAAKAASANQAVMDALEWQRNEYSAQQQREFEKEMDSTKVQRAMKDLQTAGLNPWLAVQSAGFGGSTPSGASATSSAGQVQSGQGLGSSIAGLGVTAIGLAKIFKVISKIIK